MDEPRPLLPSLEEILVTLAIGLPVRAAPIPAPKIKNSVRLIFTQT
jgi:hypothetical protein